MDRTDGAQAAPGVVDTAIAEVDVAGGALRYRGVDVRDLIGSITFGHVWGLLVDGEFNPGLPPAEPFPLPVNTGDVRVDVQSALAQLAPVWGFRPLHEITPEQARDDLSRASVMALSFIAQSARGRDRPMVPQRQVDRAATIAERFMVRWQGEPDPRHVRAVDAYWVAAAEYGLDASTLTARVVASTGADVASCLSGAVAAMSGPAHGGAPARVASLLEAVEHAGDADALVTDLLEAGARPAGFVEPVGPDARAEALRSVAEQLAVPRLDAARALERAVSTASLERDTSAGLVAGTDFWAGVLLDFAGVPARLFTPLFVCARTAGWSAHVIEQRRQGPAPRTVARYVGPAARRPQDVVGWDVVDASRDQPR